MVHLTLAGLSKDKARLVLVSDAGVEFTLDIDHRLRAALRGDEERIGQLEITMESTLRPRDIQSRIRTGASPEEVAKAAQTSVERIMPFVAPVLAERAHVAERAQGSSVRRRADGSGHGARTLGEAVAAHLSRERVQTDSVEWDAWRRDDGRWTLTAAFVAPGRKGRATFVHDVRGNYVVADDDHARWLIGEEVPTPSPSPRDDLQQARRRRAAQRVSVADALLDMPLDSREETLGDDALALVDADADALAEPAAPVAGEPAATEPDVDREQTVDLTDVAEEVRGAGAAAENLAMPAETAPEAAPAEQAPSVEVDPQRAAAPEKVSDQHDESREPGEPGEPGKSGEVASDAPAPPPQKRSTRRKRASVPSWDEIMFGGASGD